MAAQRPGKRDAKRERKEREIRVPSQIHTGFGVNKWGGYLKGKKKLGRGKAHDA